MAIYTDYIAAALMYNLQILPESLMTGILILAIVLANQSLLAMAIGAAGTQLLTGAVGRIIMKMMPDAATRTSSMDMCNTGFIGKSWDRLLRGPNAPENFWHPRAPSVYMATIGFFVGYGLAQITKRVPLLNDNTMFTRTMLYTLGFVVAAHVRPAGGYKLLGNGSGS